MRSRKQKRRLVLVASVFSLTLVVYAVGQFLTSPLVAQEKGRNWLATLYQPQGFARYIIIPDIAQALEQAQQNPTLKKISQGVAGRVLLSSPPPRVFHEVFSWLEVVPDNLKPSLLRSLFPGGMAYVASEEGAIFVAPVSAAGRALLEKKQPKFSAFKGGDFIYATRESLLQAQLNHKPNTAVGALNINPGEIGLILRPEINSDKEETNILYGAYRAFFPPELLGPQSVVISFDKNGVILRSQAEYHTRQSEIQKSIASLVPLKHLPRNMTYDGLLLELTADSEAIGGFMQGRPRERQRQPVTLYVHRFAADLGRILPDVALLADSKDNTLVGFFTQAFRKGNYAEQVTQGTVRLQYSAHEYHEPQYVFFSPHYRVDKGVFLFAAGSESFAALSAIHNQPNRIAAEYATALQQHGFKPPERVLAGVSGNLRNLLLSLEQAFTYSQPDYDRGSYGDFRDNLRVILKDVGQAYLTGFLFVHPGYVRGSFAVKL